MNAAMIPRLDIAARETSPWAFAGIILLGDTVAWRCQHEHVEQAVAFACARHARLTVCPQGRTGLATVFDVVARAKAPQSARSWAR